MTFRFKPIKMPIVGLSLHFQSNPNRNDNKSNGVIAHMTDIRLEDRKITQLRKANKATQADLAGAMFCDVDKVSKVERGLAQYSESHVKWAKKFFDIEGMPLTEHERAIFRVRLYKMRDLTREGRLSEAKDSLDEMAKLVNLDPCDDDLPMLYRAFEVIYLIAVDKIDAAEEKLTYLGGRLRDMNAEHRYYYNGNMGTLNIRRVRYIEGMEFCRQALKIAADAKDFTSDDSGLLHCRIAACYSYLCYPQRSIRYLHKTRELYATETRNDRFDLYVDGLFAYNYIILNELEEAEKLLNNCLIRAQANKDNYSITGTRNYLGQLYRKTKNWDASIENFDCVIEYFKGDNEFHKVALFNKINCLLESRSFRKAEKAIEKALALYETDEVFAIYFESRRHVLNIRRRISLPNEDSAKYLETKAIPHFIETYRYFDALDCYELLELNYKKINSMMKSLQMSLAIRDIYRRCYTYYEER